MSLPRESFSGDVHAGIAFSPEEEVEAYRRMTFVRRFEEKVGQLVALGHVPAPCQLSIGREALCVGLEMALESGDAISAGARSHGHMLMRGVPPAGLLSELMGGPQGIAGGRLGSRHIVDADRGFYGAPGPGASAVGLAAGIALAFRNTGERRVAVGVVSLECAGLARDVMELACRLALPLVVAIDDDSERRMDEDGARGSGWITAGLDVDVQEVDAIDVRKVRASALRALARARAGMGPALLILQTYRFRGHGSPPEPRGAQGRRREEMDPLVRARQRMIELQVMGEAGLKAVEKEAREKVAAAVDSARAGWAGEAR